MTPNFSLISRVMITAEEEGPLYAPVVDAVNHITYIAPLPRAGARRQRQAPVSATVRIPTIEGSPR